MCRFSEKYLTFCQYKCIVELSKLQFRKKILSMKTKIIAVAILATIILFVLLSVFPLKIVIGICAAIGLCALITSLFVMSFNAWTKLEKEDPEKAKKMWFDAMIELYNRRRMPGLF